MPIPKKTADELFERAKRRYMDARDGILHKGTNDQSLLDKWMERASFARGMQYIVRDGVYDIDLDEPTGESREVKNYIQAHLKAAIASRISHFPNPEVPAATGDPKSIARAEATERLLRSFVDDGVIDREELIRATSWSQTTGGAWLKVYWDPDAGKLIDDGGESLVEKKQVDPDTGEEFFVYEPELDRLGVPIRSRIHEGKVKVEFVDTVDGLPDPTAKKSADMRYWCHRKVKPVSEWEARFPKDFFGKKTKGRFLGGERDHAELVRNAIAGESEFVSSTQHEHRDEPVEMVEYWEPANAEWPNGMLVIWVGDVLIHLGENYLEPKRLPCVLLLGDNIVPSGLYADGMVEHLIGPQRSLNKSATRAAEWEQRILTPIMLNPLGSGIDSDEFGEIPGQVADYNPGYKPDFLVPPPIPGSLFENQEMIKSEMKEISTYSDISRGDVPQGVESGRAIAFLRENEQSIREADRIMHEKSMMELLRQCFHVARQFYPDGRIVRTLGPEGWEQATFADDDYDWDIDLAPEVFSGAPNSRALRWAETMEAFSSGLFDDSLPGAKEARKMLGLDHASRSTFDDDAGHRNIARMENNEAIRMGEGTAAEIKEVREFEDDAIHLEEHNRLRNSLTYIQMPIEVQQMLDMHCLQHEYNMQLKMMGFGANQGLLGAGGGGGSPEGQPGQESPLDGGSSPGEEQPQSQDSFVSESQQQGEFPQSA